MTRFARRNISGPQKKVHDATEWKEMKTKDDAARSNKERTVSKKDSLFKLKNTGKAGKFMDKHKGGKFHKPHSNQYPPRVCFKCQRTGHKMADCPLKGDAKEEAELFELKDRWMKEKRGDWRRQKRQKEKDSKMLCFNCRKPGHKLSECPEIKEDIEQGTGICFKCGSTEHSSSKCSLKLPPGEYPYAKCFICNETGHLSRQCPDNPRGLYPNGGCCNMCGSVEHLKRDCPEFQKQQGIGDVTVGRLSDVRSVDDDITVTTKAVAKKKKGPKVVKF